MPSVNKKNGATKNVVENNEVVTSVKTEPVEELYTMQIVLKPTFASAFQTLSLINSRGITGYDIFPTMNKGMKYQIVYQM